ncbi:MAG TPA: efflux RND transporter periplasmic adaptor subunit [Caulobacteraceae bacterium]|nr:efflux RND transporter periplasmic adaptor subunit [Caulobacteraceae bacterium]
MRNGSRFAVALFAVSLLAGCGGAGDHGSSAPAIAPAAGRYRIEPQVVADLKPVPATLTTRDMADARARISGTLTRLAVKEGDQVRQGQVIGFVHDERIGMQTGAYDAQVSAAAAQAAAANADLTRIKDLYEHGVYAQARLDQAVAQAKAANGALAAARAQRAASAELGAQGAILAPASGKVLTADVPVGSVVMPGQSIARITAGPTVVRIELPEADAAGLKVGDQVRLNPDDLRGAVSSGTITQVYPGVDKGQVVADVTAAGLPTDLVGQRVRAQIRIGERQALVAPARYVVRRFGVDYAAIVGAGGTVSEIPVETTAGPTPGTLEILSGLHAGDVLTPPGAAR